MKGKGGLDNSQCNYRGVRQRTWGKWVVEIWEPNRGKKLWLGTFDNAVAVASAYDEASRAMYGACARLNFPDFSTTNNTVSTNSQRPTCQICYKMGHTAIDCYHRMDFTYQGRHPPSKLAAMASSTHNLSSNYWISDTGATDHFTPDLANIQHPTEYTGTDTVTVVYKCCKDNNCSFHFDASKFSIQDIPSGKVLYKGLSEAGLYPIYGHPFKHTVSTTQSNSLPSVQSASVGVRASNPSTSTWHSRLEPIPNALPSLSTTTNTHPMQTRLKSGITKKKAFHTHKPDYLDTEPPSFTVASSLSPWVTAMEDEFSALHRQQTWTLVPPHPSQNVVGCKWVYKIKRNSDGTVSRYKARLVAKGFHQQAGIDYDETFSPVVKPTTVRIILTLAAQFQWPLRQLDISNAFLHGFLKEDVHMTQPQGFLDPTKPGYVCKLHKSLYGLKQAPRAWFDRFTTHLLSLGFTASTADPSLFVFHSKGAMLYLLLYVDDIILTGTSPTLITDLISTLQSTFELKDLGPLHYFLGLQLQYHTSGFTVHQTKYATDLLSRFNMTSCKPSSTPFASSSRLTPTQGHPFSDPTSFRSLVGALQYLTFTRPDLSFAVNQVCQFMHKPTDAHLMAAKRILRYLRGTLHRGLLFRPSSLHLQAYADADWAGDPVDRRSTSGNIVFHGSTPITWVSKKQNTVSRSSTEAEYRSLASTTAELFWIRMVLKDLGIFLPNPPILWCDNLSALALASNPVFHARTKHIEVDYHFVREKVLRRDVVVKFVSTSDQLADILTKYLPSPGFTRLRDKLLLSFQLP
uniref:AP2/ERF domain-containing protein n=1 Tax=Fagus sylvatica TaxID=28930 RepID=A0A2N9IFB3_FAGSY